jgi:hypothetical protein
MELVRYCVYCENEVSGDVCPHCQEYDGVVDGYRNKNGELCQFERAVCDFCHKFGDCARPGTKNICVECMNEKGMI